MQRSANTPSLLRKQAQGLLKDEPNCATDTQYFSQYKAPDSIVSRSLFWPLPGDHHTGTFYEYTLFCLAILHIDMTIAQ
ncbi:hypothetical protein G6O67_008220 [Ophiocordyceps sinensis]|uniref:Uncharacterized protein n=1 Tax=Ophiocordyceps sinensis TaxID=72228 RepID=A0A8H4LSD8_9HYPO|nr:hypothetical protein G6O67_008220 [Ophiocordyceps sinensis]